MSLSQRAIGWIVLALVFFADRLAKAWFLTRPEWEIDLGLLELSLSINRGVAFGWLADLPKSLIIFINAIIGAIFVGAYFRVKDGLERFAIAMILVGALGNFIDRLIYSYVVDYIHLRWFAPVFNLSDVMITVGAGIILSREVFFRA